MKVTQIESRIAGLGPTSPVMNHKYKQKPDVPVLGQDKTGRLKKARVGRRPKSHPKVNRKVVRAAIFR